MASVISPGRIVGAATGPMARRLLYSGRTFIPPWVSSALASAPCSWMAAESSAKRGRLSWVFFISGTWFPPSPTDTSPRFTIPAPPRALCSR